MKKIGALARHVRDEDVNPRTGTYTCVYGWRELASLAAVLGRAKTER